VLDGEEVRVGAKLLRPGYLLSDLILRRREAPSRRMAARRHLPPSFETPALGGLLRMRSERAAYFFAGAILAGT
jgi:hypothetical protein